MQIAIFAYFNWNLQEAIDGRVEGRGRIKKKGRKKREELVGRICTNFVVFHVVAEGTDAAMVRKERQGVPSLSSQTQASVALKG